MTKFFSRRENFTNINNTNNTNDTNSTNNTNFTLCVTKTSEDLLTPAGASGLASRPASQDIPLQEESLASQVGMSQEELPIIWKGLKIDLFDNGVKGSGKPSFKLKFGVIKKDGTTQSLVASMNSPTSYVWRQVDPIDFNNFHWTTIRNIQESFEQINVSYRVSKCTLPGKGGSTEFVAFLTEDNTKWNIVLVREGRSFNYSLSKNTAVTNAQRAGNIIASKFIGAQARPLITAKELGI